MNRRTNSATMEPAEVLDQLRQLLTNLEPVGGRVPTFGPLDDEPTPWSHPPPMGWEALRASLR